MEVASISIEDATSSDLSAMIAVHIDSMETDMLTRFLYGHRRVDAVRKQTESLQKVLGGRFTNPTNRCHIVKAVDLQTNELVAWALVKWEEAVSAPPAEEGSGSGSGSSEEKRDFLTFYRQQHVRNWREVTQGKAHTVLGGLYVRTEWQGKGIGKQLVEYLDSKYELDKEPLFVTTRAISEGFYAKLGWKTVLSSDIDLSEWGGKGMGYGVHRSPQMVRYPQS